MIQAASTGTPLYRRRRGISVTAAAGPTFSPSSLANLAGWWKADAGTSTTTDGVAISQWNDQSGNTRHLAQATGTKQPLYKAAIQNGLPVVRFDGTDDFMLFDAGSAFYSGTTLTFAVVYAIRSNFLNARPIAMADSTSSDFNSAATFRLIESGATLTDITRNGATPVAQTPRQANSVFAQYLGWWDGTNANLRFNRAAASTASAASAGSFGIQRVYAAAGQLNGSPDSQFGPYDIAEIVFYSADIGAPSRTSLENYLASKWGTP